MSIEKAILARAHPYMLRAKAQAIVREEVSKGCRPDLVPRPVALEPAYYPILGGENLTAPASQSPAHWIPEAPSDEDEIARLRI